MNNGNADEAFEIARHRIEEAKRHNVERLSLSDLHALEELPAEIEELSSLKILGIENTQIGEIRSVAQLGGLQELYLNGTNVRSIFQVRKLEDLFVLSLTDTQISDLRPLLSLKTLRALWFDGTPCAASNEEFAALAHLGACANPQACAAETLAYLKTLPPYPEPLPWDRPAPPTRSGDTPNLPGNKPAPVMVRTTDTGQIVPDTPSTDLENAARNRAEDAWRALINYLADLSPLRAKIDNAMPALGHAFKSFERALGIDFAVLNEIDLGMQADRLRLLSQNADAYLMDQDPAELDAFTAQLSLYMQRFNSWSQYQEDVEDSSGTRLSEDGGDFQNITDDIAKTGQVAEDVNAALKDVTDTGTASDATPLQRKGALDSHANMLDAISERGISEKSQLGETFDDFMAETEKEAGQNFRNKITEKPTVSGPIWAICFLYNNRTVLAKLAARYPSRFKFLSDVLRFLFPV